MYYLNIQLKITNSKTIKIMTNINYIIKALRNYGYRCVGEKDNNIIFAKPMGYSIVKAEIIQNNKTTNLNMVLIVKGNNDTNLVWTSANYILEDIKNSEEYYLNVVQIIMDFEADILDGKFAMEMNRKKRFDFVENTKCLNEYIF